MEGWDSGLCGEPKVISALCLSAPSPARTARRGDAQRPPACHGSRRHRGRGGARSCSSGVPRHGIPQPWGPAPWGPHRGVHTVGSAPWGPARCPNPERPGAQPLWRRRGVTAAPIRPAPLPPLRIPGGRPGVIFAPGSGVPRAGAWRAAGIGLCAGNRARHRELSTTPATAPAPGTGH